jgi:uncharacterized protein
MRLSAMKINHLAHVVADGLYREESIDFAVDKNEVRLRIKTLIMEELQLDDDIDRVARETIDSFSRRIPEGSKEWEVVYNKIYAEEMGKRRRF